MINKKILVVDDEKNINDIVVSYLENDGFSTCSALNAEEGIKQVEKENPDLILLDVMLPDKNGIDLCMEIRKRGYNIPILFLSCKAEEVNKIVALSVGGDDYITKPFMPGELIARVKAHLRRFDNIKSELLEEVYTAPGLLINVNTREIYVDDQLISATAKEFDILLLLIKNPRRIYNAAQIFQHAWRANSISGDEKTIMVHISTLRKKIENNKENYKYILSIRGMGYKFNHQLLEK